MLSLFIYALGSFHSGQNRESGQGLVEYALIMIFVAVVLILLLTLLGPGVKNIYSNILNEVQTAGT
jgi:pilus assembly protein Flp/PilA